MDFQDRGLNCLDCHQPFIFTAGEQEFYEKKGFREEPKRCRPCREARKNKRQDGGIAKMRGGAAAHDDESLGNRADDGAGWSGGARSGNGRQAGGGGGNGGGGTREMFDATCAQCGAAARVPFRPSPGRPVYCKDCFGSRAGAP